MEYASLCRKHEIRAFPTLRWFHNGEAFKPDYKMDRTVDAFMAYAKNRLAAERASEVGDFILGSGGTNSPVPRGTASPVPPQPIGSSSMTSMCRAAGLPFGRPKDEMQSDEGGNEFSDFAGFQVKVAPACRSATQNARGKYNSFFAPCEFRFHRAPKYDSAPKFRSSMQLSTKCSSENIYNPGGELDTEQPIADYVRGWPDECVGDYTRCYSVSKESERKIFLTHFCRNSWEIPSSVTHISVSCQDDKQAALEQKGMDTGSSHLELLDRHHREKVMVVLLIVLLSCCGCWVCLCLGYSFVFVPYLKAIKKSKSDPDLQSLVQKN